MRFLVKFFSILILTVGFSTFVQADPIRITSGTVNNSSINVQGTSTNISITPTNGVAIDTLTNSRFQFASGANATPIVDAFGGYGGTSSFSFNGGATIAGVGYAGAAFGGGNGFGSNFTFTPTQPILFPPSPAGGSGTFSVQVPFAMQGFLSGLSCPNGTQLGTCNAIPGTSFFGSGNANFTFTYLPNQTWGLSRYEYTFSATPEPTPEPATILLLGTGLAGVVGYARRKKRQQG